MNLRNNKTSCILEHTRKELTAKTAINIYGRVWWWSNKTPVRLVDTGLHVDLRDRKTVEILKRHPYEIQPANIIDIMSEISEAGISFIQVITEAIEPIEVTLLELRNLCLSTKEIDHNLPVRLKDIITGRTYQMVSMKRNEITIMEVK